MTQERFVTRWGLVLAALGMAVGTGNLWRFPRVLAANGGGPFLIPWLLFLFSWSIPLLVLEASMGRRSRRGTVGAFVAFAGKRSAWKGAFVAFCSLAIGFYYCVVTGWCLRYLLASLSGGLQASDKSAFWAAFHGSAGQQVTFQVLALGISMALIAWGASGIERVNRVLIPSLFVILLVAAARALTLPGAGRGLEFMFRFDLGALADHTIWLEALSQSAWSTGAGYGLMLTYAVYMRRERSPVYIAVTTGLGNNSASLLAALALIPTVFALVPSEEALAKVMEAGPASTGMTFIYFPELLDRLALGGALLTPLFFLGLSFAALSSMMSVLELGVRNFVDYGFRRRSAIAWVGGITLVLGLPSALSPTIFSNQDWVWGFGLLLSGFLFATAVRALSSRELLDRWINTGGGWHAGPAVAWVLRWLIPVQFVALVAWWGYQAVVAIDPEGWWNPLRPTSLATVAVQWLSVVGIFYLLNRCLARAGEGGA